MKIKEWLTYLLIFLLPTQLGKHFFFPFSYVSGVRIDYLAPTLYLIDCLIFILLFLSIKDIKISFNKKILIFLLLITLNIFFSLSPWISLYKWFKLAEVIGLFFILKIQLQPKYVLIALVSSALLQLSLVIFQISQRHALQGIAYLFGERYFSISTPGIAKVALQGVEILRGYGTFSHPNSLGGFFLLLYTYILFEKKFNTYLILKYTFLGISSLLIFLSFSKITIIAFLMITGLFVVKNISCKFCALGRMLILIVLSLLFITAQGDGESIQKRVYLAQNAIQTIVQYPLLGTGLGSYLKAQTQFSIPYSYLFFQPVHNIFLLSLAETGFFLFGILMYYFYLAIKYLGKNKTALALLFIIVFTGFFDHYWLTLQQNILVIAVVFGLLKNQKWS